MTLRQAAWISLLLIATPAAAQTGPPSRPPPAKPSAPPPAPAAPPAPATAPAVAPEQETLFGQSWRAVALVGLDLGEGDTAFKVRADLETPLYQLAPRTLLSIVLSAGYVRGGDDPPAQTVLGVTTDTKATSNLFEVVPALRLGYSLLPRLTVYGDAGLGFYYFTATARATTSVPGLPPLSVNVDDSGFGAVFRLAGGAAFELSPRLSIAAEVLGLNFRRGDGSATTVSVLMGPSFRL